jgi:hypothetical protein
VTSGTKWFFAPFYLKVKLMILYQDEFLFIKQDDIFRFSVICKKPYGKIKIYEMPQENALQTFHEEYNDLLEYIMSDLYNQEKNIFSAGDGL